MDESEIKQVFDYLDVGKQGAINKDQIPIAIRYLGIIKTQSDFAFILKDLEDTVNYDKFVEIIKQEKSTAIGKEQLLNSFSPFDEAKTGKCDAKELFHALSVIGEKLSQEDVEKLQKICGVEGSGKIEYSKIVNGLMKEEN